MQYRSEATSVEGFVQQIACCYLRHGYWFYVTGRIPDRKNPEDVDRKLIEKYGIAVSESTRARRKRLGQANLQYLRYRRFFVILATHGTHRFFDDEAESIRDIRRIPLQFHGYSISYRRGGRTRDGKRDHRWHAHVSIERQRYLELRDYFLELGTRRSVEQVVLQFYRIPFEPYAPVRRQLLNLHRAVNRTRKRSGFAALPIEVVPLRRRVVRPYS
ncbi:MAG: hypothetical protein ACYTGL_30205 [Planctomycetota bacterium]|jgi:hypothetical protein